MAPHSSTLAWKIPWMEEPGRLQSMGLLGVGHDWATSLSLSCIGEGNGNPLQRSCLENPMDGGTSWAAVYGVAQNQTRLKRLSSSSSSDKVKVTAIGRQRWGRPLWPRGEEFACQCWGHGFDPWSGKIPHIASTEACVPRACAPQQESSRHSPQLERSWAWRWGPSTDKNKYKLKKFF